MSLLATGNSEKKKPLNERLRDFFTLPPSEIKPRLLPVILFVLLLIADQISKALVVAFVAQGQSIHCVGNWILLTHAKNEGIAWGMFSHLEGFGKIFFLILIPLIFLSFFSVWTFFTRELTRFQRWVSTVIIAGGFGNLIDRIFRFNTGGVIDFIDMAFFRIPTVCPNGRWPTFNFADSYIVIGVTLLVLSLLISEIVEHRRKKAR